MLVVIHTPALDVLLIERADHPGYWQSVTGSKDRADEPLARPAVREVAEETGIEIGSPDVPLAALHDWGLRNVYEIYPVLAPPLRAGRHPQHRACVRPDACRPARRCGWRRASTCAYAWLPWREAADRCFSPSNAEAILHAAALRRR